MLFSLSCLAGFLFIHPGVASSQIPPKDSCSPHSTSPNLSYTISPNFIWFPGSIEPADILALLRSTNPRLFSPATALPTAGTPAAAAAGTIKATIKDFLSSPCTFTLTVHTSPAASAVQNMRLLNETLGSSDLLCRLATHKTGRVWTEKPHTMLSMHLKGMIVPAAAPAPPPQGPASPKAPRPPKGAPRIAVEAEAAAAPAVPTGFEYVISCPASFGKPLNGPADLEGLADLAFVRDCGWCRKAADELLNMCDAGRGQFEEVLRDRGWAFGGAKCEGC